MSFRFVKRENAPAELPDELSSIDIAKVNDDVKAFYTCVMGERPTGHKSVFVAPQQLNNIVINYTQKDA